MIILSKSPSRNRKIAKIAGDVVQWPFVYTSYREVGATCPTRCGFHPAHESARVEGRSCYARVGRTALHARRATPAPTDGEQTRSWILALPPQAAVRLHVSGDFFAGDTLDVAYFTAVCEAFAARPDLRGWVYTHAPFATWLEMREAAPANLAVNWSCDSLDEAQAAQDAGHTGVTCVMPANAERVKGVTLCPEQTSGIPCADCQLCWKGDRRTIVGFLAH